MKLRTLKPRVSTLSQSSAIHTAPTASERRISGRRLQERRMRVWTKDPHCVDCGRLTAFPDGFELDHDIPLHQGGADEDFNCRIRCVHVDDKGMKAGCHALKTAREAGGHGVRGGSHVCGHYGWKPRTPLASTITPIQTESNGRG